MHILLFLVINFWVVDLIWLMGMKKKKEKEEEEMLLFNISRKYI